jgi:hypothetical protein
MQALHGYYCIDRPPEILETAYEGLACHVDTMRPCFALIE